MRPAGCPDRETLAALAAGRLSGETLSGVAAHLDGCPACLAAAQAENTETDPLVAALCRGDPADPYAREGGCRLAHAWPPTSDQDDWACDPPTLIPPGHLPPPGASTGPADCVGRYRPVRLHARGGLGEIHVALDEELS